MAFFGRETVLADLRLHKDQAGLVTTGVLHLRTTGDTFTTVAYANVCLWPVRKSSAIGPGGMPRTGGTITVWRVAETTAPTVDCKLVVGGSTYLVNEVTARHNHDEASNYAIYDCQVAKAG